MYVRDQGYCTWFHTKGIKISFSYLSSLIFCCHGCLMALCLMKKIPTEIKLINGQWGYNKVTADFVLGQHEYLLIMIQFTGLRIGRWVFDACA